MKGQWLHQPREGFEPPTRKGKWATNTSRNDTNLPPQSDHIYKRLAINRRRVLNTGWLWSLNILVWTPNGIPYYAEFSTAECRRLDALGVYCRYTLYVQSPVYWLSRICSAQQ